MGLIDALCGSGMSDQGVVRKQNGGKQCTCPCGSSSAAWMCKDSYKATWDCPIESNSVPTPIPLTCPMFASNTTGQHFALPNTHRGWRSWSSLSGWNLSSSHPSTSWRGQNVMNLIDVPLWSFLIIVGSLALIFFLAWLATRTSPGESERDSSHTEMSEASRQRVMNLGQHGGHSEHHQFHDRRLPQRGNSVSSSFHGIHPGIRQNKQWHPGFNQN